MTNQVAHLVTVVKELKNRKFESSFGQSVEKVVSNEATTNSDSDIDFRTSKVYQEKN